MVSPIILPGDFKGAAHPLSSTAIALAATRLDVPVATIKAVWKVETNGNAPFDAQGRPHILYERHIFHRQTGGRFDMHYPSISKGYGGGYGKFSEQYDKLKLAMTLDNEAALKSCSWGAFQILGTNYEICGYKTVFFFVGAMCESADNQLDAFIRYVESRGLAKWLRAKNWKEFAEGYNGKGYKQNEYDTKLEDAYLAAGGK